MAIYEHACRDCSTEWEVEYSIHDERPTLPCPKCGSSDTYRCVTTSRAVHFKGAGWSGDGYYKYNAYDQHKSEGKAVKLYDNREDIAREIKGEKAAAVKKRLKKEDELAKKYMGPDAALTEAKANARIKKAVDAVNVP
jgi:putative FmdB family regulatory protein